jgi:hypothetical protein
MGMVFGLALRQTEGLIGSVIGQLGLDLAVPDHTTLSRRAKTLDVPPLRRAGTGPLHLLVDSTGLKLGGAGEWLVEKHGRLAAARGASCISLLDQIADPIGSLTADGDYDQDQVYQAVIEHHPDAAVIVPPRATAVLSASAETAPTQRDSHLQTIT